MTRMDVGLLMAVRNHPDRPYALADVYDDYISDAVLAEELGFDHVWLGEHRMTADQWTPSPLMVLSTIAAHTTRVRLGPAVLCLPFHNPLRLAEDLAVLDVLSQGRLDVGIGPGSQYEEYRTFGVDIPTRVGRTWEAADLIQRCLASAETFSWAGRHYTFPEITFTTRPVQERVPFFSAAMGPQSVARAAAKGWHLIADRKPAYDAALREHGRDPASFQAVQLQMVHVAPTHEQAVEEAVEGLHHFANFYTTRLRLDGTMPPAEAELTRDEIRAGSLRYFGTPAVGTPDEVTEILLAARDRAPGTTGFAMGFRHAGMRTPEVHRSLRLFAAEVAPHLSRSCS